MKRIVVIILGVAFVAVVGLWVLSKEVPGNNQVKSQRKITASFYPLYFFASQIAGDKAEVYNITPAGAEPHEYDLSTADRAAIENSFLLILNGAMLEPWGSDMKSILSGTQTKVAVVGEKLADQIIGEEGETGKDPHVWLDPLLAKKVAASITDAMVEADPQNADFYRMNEQTLTAQLEALDQKFRAKLENCQQRNIVTTHSAFGYLAKEYGLNQVSIYGLSPDAEPSAKTLANIAAYAKKNNVKYIFFESLVSPKLAETIAKEIGVQTMVLDPLEGLTDFEVAAGENYFTVMEENLKNLQTALECKPAQ